MWKLYDELIGPIGEDIIVKDYYIGDNWTMVKTDTSVGVSMTVHSESRPKMHNGNIIGESLKKVAGLSKSWNFKEASLGVAAINAYYNTVEKADKFSLLSSNIGHKDKDAFLTYQEEVKGKKVAVIGHFPFLEQRFMPICDLSILERNPSEGDYPDSACEYILRSQDYVFITGVTLINKTLPRLLEICKDVNVVLVGPSVPIANEIFNRGVYDISGFVVIDTESCKDIIMNNPCRDLFKSGQMVSFEK